METITILRDDYNNVILNGSYALRIAYSTCKREWFLCGVNVTGNKKNIDIILIALNKYYNTIKNKIA